MKTIIVSLTILLFAIAISIGITALLVWLISLLVPAVAFSWKLTLIVWLIICCIKYITKSFQKKDND